MKECLITGCFKIPKARGWCGTHYERWRRNGTPEKIMNRCHETHEYEDHPLYKILSGMLQRCYNSKRHNYKFYGAKGIFVCVEWQKSPNSFVKWALNNGWKAGLTIDRREASDGYHPNNCRFITSRENSSRTNRREILYGGKSLRQWERETGVYYQKIWNRIHILGWTIERAAA